MPALLERLTSEVKASVEATPAPEKPREPVPPTDAPRGKGRIGPDGRLTIKLPRHIRRRAEHASRGWDYDTPAAPSAPARPASPPPPAAEVVYQREAPAPAPEPTPAVPPEPVVPLAPRVQLVAAPREGPENPETVHIPDLGTYEIDVRRLLEKSPIVVQKDGSYMIHLPSLFEMGNDDKS